MRLPEAVRVAILESAGLTFGDVSVYLFGSRTDDSKKGGDIDLAVKFDSDKYDFKLKRLRFLSQMTRRGVDYPLDIVQYGVETPSLLKTEIERTGIRL